MSARMAAWSLMLFLAAFAFCQQVLFAFTGHGSMFELLLTTVGVVAVLLLLPRGSSGGPGGGSPPDASSGAV